MSFNSLVEYSIVDMLDHQETGLDRLRHQPSPFIGLYSCQSLTGTHIAYYVPRVGYDPIRFSAGTSTSLAVR
jgi:hypothetical protein